MEKAEISQEMVQMPCGNMDNMVPHSWISECLEMFGIANSVQDFLNNNIKSCWLALNTSGEKLEVNIRT